MTTTQLGGLVTLVAIAVTALSLIVLHVLPTGLKPLRDPVSQYGITRYRAGYAVAGISAGAAGIGAILVLAPLPGSIATVILLAVFAGARILIPAVPMDEPGTGPSRRGRLHNILAFLAFGAVTAAGFVAAGLLHDAGHATASMLSTAFAVVMAVGAVGLLVTRLSHGLRSLFGAAERLIYLGFIAWFVLVGATALSGPLAAG
jgi:hypothetical protein